MYLYYSVSVCYDIVSATLILSCQSLLYYLASHCYLILPVRLELLCQWFLFYCARRSYNYGLVTVILFFQSFLYYSLSHNSTYVPKNNYFFVLLSYLVFTVYYFINHPYTIAHVTFPPFFQEHFHYFPGDSWVYYCTSTLQSLLYHYSRHY